MSPALHQGWIDMNEDLGKLLGRRGGWRDSWLRPNMRVQLTGRPVVVQVHGGDRTAFPVYSLPGTGRSLRSLGLQLTRQPLDGSSRSRDTG
jgi:hypothetical protein